jgi:hypothetical protein
VDAFMSRTRKNGTACLTLVSIFAPRRVPRTDLSVPPNGLARQLPRANRSRLTTLTG